MRRDDDVVEALHLVADTQLDAVGECVGSSARRARGEAGRRAARRSCRRRNGCHRKPSASGSARSRACRDCRRSGSRTQPGTRGRAPVPSTRARRSEARGSDDGIVANTHCASRYSPSDIGLVSPASPSAASARSPRAELGIPDSPRWSAARTAAAPSTQARSRCSRPRTTCQTRASQSRAPRRAGRAAGSCARCGRESQCRAPARRGRRVLACPPGRRSLSNT